MLNDFIEKVIVHRENANIVGRSVAPTFCNKFSSLNVRNSQWKPAQTAFRYYRAM